MADADGVEVAVIVEPSSEEESIEEVAAAAKVDDAAAEMLDEAGISVGMVPSTK